MSTGKSAKSSMRTSASATAQKIIIARDADTNNGQEHDIKRELLSSKMGVAGIAILAGLILTSVITIVAIPVETFQEWNNPKSWISYPKTAVPAWVNVMPGEKIPEHLIFDAPSSVFVQHGATITQTAHEFVIDYMYDDFPNDFIYRFSSEYAGSPLIQMSITRPDGHTLQLLSKPLPNSEDASASHTERIFSTDSIVRKNVMLQSYIYDYDISSMPVEDVLFAQRKYNNDVVTDAADAAASATTTTTAAAGKTQSVLQGTYAVQVRFYSTHNDLEIQESQLIVGGKAFGLMGTDELRRDLAIGLLWGTPLALFIGITVAVASVMAGLLYGVYAGYRGKKTDETMMRFNDVIYALPALPFLIILSVTVSNSILLMVGFLMIFGWVGVAKVARSMSLQIKTRGYVDAAEIMGQSRFVIMTKHIIPQLLPYAFASIAISVPAAITTEAGLSFLGLGDPSFPTWGQILHDANTFGAAARGLWWWMMPPGIMIAITGLAFVFIGNALDSIVNPKLKRR